MYSSSRDVLSTANPDSKRFHSDLVYNPNFQSGTDQTAKSAVMKSKQIYWLLFIVMFNNSY